MAHNSADVYAAFCQLSRWLSTQFQLLLEQRRRIFLIAARITAGIFRRFRLAAKVRNHRPQASMRHRYSRHALVLQWSLHDI